MHLTYTNKNCIILNWIVMKPIGDWICKKGSYSLSNCMYLTVHCWTCEYGTNLKIWSSYTLNMALYLRASLHQ